MFSSVHFASMIGLLTYSVEYQNILLNFVKSVCTFTIIHFITAFMFNKLLSLSLSLSL